MYLFHKYYYSLDVPLWYGLTPVAPLTTYLDPTSVKTPTKLLTNKCY